MSILTLPSRITLYKELSKSGVVTLVMVSVLGGYFCGFPLGKEFSITHLAVSLFGIFVLAAGSSALNQLQEKSLDREMPRTKKRPLPSGRMSSREALIFCAVSLSLGFTILGALDLNVMILGAITVFSYNILYTLWWKPTLAFGAIPGAIPGAMPILMGYAAASGTVMEPGGWYLFALLFFWQMPHFWVLALKYKNDYAAGGIPTLPVALGARKTIYQISVWSFCYVALSLIAPLFMKVGALYVAVAVLTGAKVLFELYRFSRAPLNAIEKHWLKFFLWVNFSLIFYIAAAVADLWSVYLTVYFTR